MRAWIADRYLVVVSLCAALAIALMFILGGGGTGAPTARGGDLDLTGWDFARQGVLPLNGEWEFYPNQLLGPEDLAGRSGPAPAHLRVPSVWNGDSGMRAHGYGTYRLRVKVRPTDELLAIQKKIIRFSDRIYVNGRLIGQSGLPAASRAEYEPGNAPHLGSFPVPADGTLDIVVQVANYEYKSGGIVSPLTLGLSNELATVRQAQISLEWTGVIVLLIFSVLFLVLYGLFNRNSTFLFFGLFFFFFGIAIWFNGERTFMQMFPDVPFELAWKIKDFTIFATFPLLAVYTLRSFELGAGRGIMAGLSVAYAAYCAAIAVLPYRVYTQLLETFMYSFPAAFGLLLFLLVRLYVQGRYGPYGKTEIQMFIPAIACLALFQINLFLFQGFRPASTGLTYFLVLLFVVLVIAQLAYRYYRTYTSMVALTKRLQIEDQKKDEFLLRTSHELNTPLHGIIGLSQAALEEPAPTAAGRRAREKALTIRNIAYRMANMVNDLIDLAKLREGRLVVRLERVDLEACVRTAFEVYGFQAKEQGIALMSGIDPAARYVRADESRLMQVLSNLLDQCMRGSEGGSVTIAARIDGENVKVEIRGEEGDRPYGRLQKGVSGVREESMREEDADVGLMTAIELVRLMDGELVASAFDPGVAPRFLVSIPTELPPAIPPGIGDARGETAAGSEAGWEPGPEEEPDEELREGLAGGEAGCVLVAGDLSSHLEWLTELLAMEGYRVVTAHSDTEVWRVVDSPRRPDLALLDVMLPGSGGFETGRRIREVHTPMELPILFLMSRSTPADVSAAIAAGGNDFVSKPLDAGEIRVRIRTLLTMKRLAKEAAASEMAFLQSQIKPHFLYNALGTIMSLCYTDGPRAGELLAVFSRYLRMIFHQNGPDETVTLRKEMELVRAYADIEKERFGKRLTLEIEADERLLDTPIPPLTVQPLVENAIRHGVAPKVEGGTVRLRLALHPGQIRITVEDDGVGMAAERLQAVQRDGGTGEGVGLANIMRRVRHRTGRLPELASVPGQGTKVTIWLPIPAKIGTDDRQGGEKR
ncbi:ATP-binding protein [Cohnella zeiphila]|uniref:histidine kinase n=1 Tax=Cohnella zeiphila TaxID=2761120 RepID=A0A7X0VYM1_9BACL|nr:ATP-binding protein [Cohnella zeiphila]MBB6733103.1 histidine kinase [Cohnella zeiphila]